VAGLVPATSRRYEGVPCPGMKACPAAGMKACPAADIRRTLPRYEGVPYRQQQGVACASADAAGIAIPGAGGRHQAGHYTNTQGLRPFSMNGNLIICQPGRATGG